MDSKHTQKPWELFSDDGQWRIRRVVPRGAGIAEFIGAELAVLKLGSDAEAIGLRIVSCVNACAGINPEAVPAMLEALEEVIEQFGTACECVDGEGEHCSLCLARAALAKAKGG